MTSYIKGGSFPLSVLQQVRESVQLSLDRLSAIHQYYQSSKFLAAPDFTGSPQVTGVRYNEMRPGTVNNLYLQMDMFSFAAPEAVICYLQHPDTQSRARNAQAKCSFYSSGSISGHEITLSRMMCPGVMQPTTNIIIHVAAALDDGSFVVTCSSVEHCPEIPPLVLGLPEFPSPFAAYIVRPQPYLCPDGCCRTGSAITLLLEVCPSNLPALAEACPPQDWATTVVPLAQAWANNQVQIATSLSQGLPIDCIGALDRQQKVQPVLAQGQYGPLTAAQDYHRLIQSTRFSIVSLLGEVVRSNRVMATQIMEAETKSRTNRRGRPRKKK